MTTPTQRDALLALVESAQASDDPHTALDMLIGQLRDLANAASFVDTTAQRDDALLSLVERAIPFLRDEGAKYDDDGSNEPLELAREIEAALAAPAAGAAAQGEAVAWMVKCDKVADFVTIYFGEAQTMARIRDGGRVLPLYTSPPAASAVAVDDGLEFFAIPEGLNPQTVNLVARFATALAEKLAAAERKYGYSDGWAESDWMGECRAKLVEHVAKGDPRDVAAYCAFLWHHGERTALPAVAVDEAAVERAAIAVHDERRRHTWRSGWGGMIEEYKDRERRYARAALTAALAQPSAERREGQP